jgi:predicted ATPase
MSILPLHLRNVLAELRRRKVVRVVAAYAVSAFFIVEVVDRAGHVIGLPPGSGDTIVVFALLGLPVAVLLSWLYDVVPDRGADPSTDDNAPVVVGPVPQWRVLPSYATAFFGRAAELRELRDLFADRDVRLITILGPGGTGKTRLAVRAAELVAPGFRDGVAYVPLGSLAEAVLLPQALVHALGLSVSRDDQTGEELIDFLRPKQMLLLLDNFDEVTAEAGVLARILEHAPDVRLLVTTRERLNLLEETLLTLDGLKHEGAESDAVQLFVNAARRHDHHFRADAQELPYVERICALVVGMPLALELAAAWVRVLSCAEICKALERGIDILSNTAPGVPARHRSMRAVFDASWQLLSENEARAAARLSVLRSGFDLHAATAVADLDAQVLRLLLDKSFLNRIDGRFVMLAVVRQYALERLAADPDDELAARRRHMQHFTDQLAAHEQAVIRCEPAAIDQISRAIDEIRAAWSFAVQDQDEEALLRAVNPLFHFYDGRGWTREGLEAFGRAAAAIDADGSGDGDAPARPGARAALLARLDVRRGVLHSRMGELAAAEILLQRGVAAARERGDTEEVVFALNRLGANWLLAGKYAQAESAHAEARALAEISRDSHGMGWSLTHLGNLAWARGEYDTAARYHTAALDVLREQNDRSGMWACVNNLGAIAYVQKDHVEACRRFRDGLELQQELRNRRSTAMLLHNLGCAEVLAKDYASAREHLRQALAASEEMGNQRMCALSLVAMADLSVQEGAHAAAAHDFSRALSIAAGANNQPVTLEVLLGMAQLRQLQGDTDGALQLAHVVAVHPASDEDARAKARRLLDDAAQSGVRPLEDSGGGTGIVEPIPELDRLIAELLEEKHPTVEV